MAGGSHIEHVRADKTRYKEEIFPGETLWLVEGGEQIAMRALVSDWEPKLGGEVTSYTSSWQRAPLPRVAIVRTGSGIDLRASGFTALEGIAWEVSSDAVNWSLYRTTEADPAGDAAITVPTSEAVPPGTRVFRARQ